MERYKDINGDSGVVAYECGSDFIVVKFDSGMFYEYTYNSAGVTNVEHMKVLARSGDGLNAFINKVVSKLYANKHR